MSLAIAHAILGAAAFGIVLAWWERGEGPQPRQGKLAPWVFVRLVAAFWVLALLIMGRRAPALAWGLAPLSVLMLAPWWVCRAIIQVTGRAPAPIAWLAALPFDAQPRLAVRTAEIYAARERTDTERLAQLHAIGALDPLHIAAGALAKHMSGESDIAKAWVDALDDFGDAPPKPIQDLLDAIAQELDSIPSGLAAAPESPSPDVRAVLEALSSPQARPGDEHVGGASPEPQLAFLDGWRSKWSGRVDVAALESKLAKEIRGLTRTKSARLDEATGPLLVDLESRLEAASVDPRLEWPVWVQIRTAIARAPAVEAACQLAGAEPALIALAARAWSDPDTRAFSGAILSFVEAQAVRVQDHARADRARLQLQLVA